LYDKGLAPVSTGSSNNDALHDLLPGCPGLMPAPGPVRAPGRDPTPAGAAFVASRSVAIRAVFQTPTWVGKTCSCSTMTRTDGRSTTSCHRPRRPATPDEYALGCLSVAASGWPVIVGVAVECGGFGAARSSTHVRCAVPGESPGGRAEHAPGAGTDVRRLDPDVAPRKHRAAAPRPARHEPATQPDQLRGGQAAPPPTSRLGAYPAHQEHGAVRTSDRPTASGLAGTSRAIAVPVRVKTVRRGAAAGGRGAGWPQADRVPATITAGRPDSPRRRTGRPGRARAGRAPPSTATATPGRPPCWPEAPREARPTWNRDLGQRDAEAADDEQADEAAPALRRARSRWRPIAPGGPPPR